MEREQVEEVWRKTSAAGSPRSRLFRAMADSHPGGGYRLYRIMRSARDLRSSPRHVQLSQADSPTLDLSEGLAEARRAGVAYVIISSLGARPDRARELRRFFDELFREGSLAKEFVPGWWEAGPTLRVFRLVY
jgi:hypothetical protein